MARFDGERYMTRGIQAEISLTLQILMWSMIDDDVQSGKEVDYLQVFVLKPSVVNGITLQRIEHRQEQPDRLRVINMDTGEPPVSAKIFVIDDVNHATMLLADEY